MSCIKLVVVGTGNTGKTSLIISYLTNTFPNDHTPTVFDSYTGNVIVDGRVVNLMAMDTAGQDEYDKMRPIAYSNTDVFMIVFSVINKPSFKNVASKWHPELEFHSPGVPILLVGTKCDLRSDEEKDVGAEEAKQCAQKLGMNYFECSALTQQGLKVLFDAAIHAALDKTKESKCGCIVL